LASAGTIPEDRLDSQTRVVTRLFQIPVGIRLYAF
jgi:hypothetical protein